MDNLMILNNKNIGISYAEINDDELFLYSSDSRYSFKVYLASNGEIDKIKALSVGEKKYIQFSEYVLSENNIPALINPGISYVHKVTDNKLVFYFKCDNFDNVVYMSLKNHFDIILKSLEIRIIFNFNDYQNKRIIYRF